MLRMLVVEACVLRNSSFNRHHRIPSSAGLLPAILLVVYVVIRLIGS